MQIITQRLPINELLVRKRHRLLRLGVPTAHIPLDELLPGPDNPHLEPLDSKHLPSVLFRPREHLPPDPARLAQGVDGEEAKVGEVAVVALKDLAAGRQRTGLVMGQEDDAVGLGDLAEDACLVDALVGDEVGLCRPASAAGLAAVGGADELEDGGDVGGEGFAEGEGDGGHGVRHCGSFYGWNRRRGFLGRFE